MRNISECPTAEPDLQASEACYRRLFEAARDGILILDPDAKPMAGMNGHAVRNGLMK